MGTSVFFVPKPFQFSLFRGNFFYSTLSFFPFSGNFFTHTVRGPFALKLVFYTFPVHPAAAFVLQQLSLKKSWAPFCEKSNVKKFFRSTPVWPLHSGLRG